MREESFRVYREVNKNLQVEKQLSDLKRVSTDWKSLLQYTILRATFRTARNTVYVILRNSEIT